MSIIAYLQQRLTDSEVPIDGYSHHDHGRQGDIGGDEEHVDLADDVRVDDMFDVLHVYSVRDDDETGAEVNDRQGKDEDRRDKAVLTSTEHTEDEGVPYGADDTEDGQEDYYHDRFQAASFIIIRVNVFLVVQAYFSFNLLSYIHGLFICPCCR